MEKNPNKRIINKRKWKLIEGVTQQSEEKNKQNRKRGKERT